MNIHNVTHNTSKYLPIYLRLIRKIEGKVKINYFIKKFIEEKLNKHTFFVIDCLLR